MNERFNNRFKNIFKMKYIEYRIQKNQAVLKLLKTAEEMFNAYPADAAKLTEFEQLLNQLTEAHAKLMVPAIVHQRQSSEQREQLRSETVNLFNRGLALAEALKDPVLRESFRIYLRQAKRAGTFQLLQLTDMACKSVTDNQQVADGLGLTAAYITSLRTKLSSFSEQQEQTMMLYATRKVDRSKIHRLLHELHQLLTLHIDPAVTMHTNREGDFYEQWRNLRKTVRHRKRAEKDTTLSSLLGTVTDAVTGKPLPGALVSVVEQQGVATTDVDGMYLIEGLLPGWLTIACTLNGYVVAENQRYEIRESEELEVNFSLMAQQAVA